MLTEAIHHEIKYTHGVRYDQGITYFDSRIVTDTSEIQF